MTATTFWSAETATHSAPSDGQAMTAWTSPPVTMLAVPTVRSTNPQKIPACSSPARGSRNIFRWASAYSTKPTTRRGTFANGRDGRATAKIRRWRAMTTPKTTAAP